MRKTMIPASLSSSVVSSTLQQLWLTPATKQTKLRRWKANWSLTALSLAGLAASIALGSVAANAQVNVSKPSYKFEKCYGVAKAGHNDCFSAGNACGNTSKVDNERDAWVYVPAGVCKKLTGGSLAPKDDTPKK
jgi:uncharacterized membrane protein